jgi:D-glycero-D-manno-heptose 1,7-bisphosphate phosphatase
MQKCLFLDRDGVINHDIGYAYQKEHIEFVSGIFDLCRWAEENHYLIIVITNQSGIARGFYTEQDFAALTQWLQQSFAEQGIRITDTFHCPHHPDLTGECECRKPAPGMLLAAIKKYQINPQFSIMIGDKPSDMVAAKAANIGTRILLDTQGKTPKEAASFVTTSLAQITDRLRLIQ